MKAIFSFALLGGLLLTGSVFAEVDDTSVIEQLSAQNTKVLDTDISLKSFESCNDFENVMEDYIQDYYKNSPNRGWWGGVLYGKPMMMDDAVMEMSVESAAPSDSLAGQKTANIAVGWAQNDFSETNVQVAGVDEGDIVKTDGKYLYYFSQTDHTVSIIETKYASASIKDAQVLKRIHLPDTFYNHALYVTDNRLVILASGYSNYDYSTSWFYINRNEKTYSIVFDVSNHAQPELTKLYVSDGTLQNSRRIGDMIYVISNNYFNFPYVYPMGVEDMDLSSEKMLPQKLDISRSNDALEANLTLNGEKLPYHVVAGAVGDCNKISYHLPDEETLKNTSFNPGYTMISSLDIMDSNREVDTHIVAGNNTQVYMSQDNLYLTEGMWQANNFSCPPNARCAMPFFWGGTQNTLIHKLAVEKDTGVSYTTSGLVPGAPLTQYSMDEFQGDFRIITSQWQPKASTSLYILDEDLDTVSSLENLAPGETFQSSRFIGDKLFLVTFEQVDPLFAIDMSDNKKPVILWELKIPGFSTYLHPYDENHLIGLGYDTKTNQWGGTETAGLKVDLYKINYDKKCGDSGLSSEMQKKCESGDYKWIIVEQQYSTVLWGKGSYSEALNNPRMFVWSDAKKTLLLPATLSQRDANWRLQSYENGLYALKISESTGIELTGSASLLDTSWLEDKRKKECSTYTGNSQEPQCRELLNGEMSCSSGSYTYIPNYCFKDASLYEYIGEKEWEFQNMKMNRALYIGESIYGFSDANLGVYDWNLKQQSKISLQK